MRDQRLTHREPTEKGDCQNDRKKFVKTYLVFFVSQEIGRRRSGRYDSFFVGHGVEQLGVPLIGIGERQNGGDVAAAVAIVGRRPNRHQLFVEHVLVTCK